MCGEVNVCRGGGRGDCLICTTFGAMYNICHARLPLLVLPQAVVV